MINSSRTKIFLAGLTLLFLYSCKYQNADMVLKNGLIHTLDGKGDVVQALAIKDGRIIATGTTDDILFDFKADTIIDLMGRSVFPGFIDAHCHYVGYAKESFKIDLKGTTSFEEVVQRVDSFAALSKAEWIMGRGWDQNDWKEHDFPVNSLLNEKFPDRPVVLVRVDGHAAIANAEALRRANITAETSVRGGQIISQNGKPTGVLIDNAMELVLGKIPEFDQKALIQALIRAQKDLFEVGLTTVDDAGLDKATIFLIDSLQKSGDIKIRVYAMADPKKETLDYFIKNGPLKTDRLHVTSFKLYADGALGSRGACLLRPYKDQPGQTGFLLESINYYRDIAKKIYDAGFQLNTHCIGDSANRMMLRIYGNLLGEENDRRWRIEHCQVVDTNDFQLFGKYKIWPSVQPTHATSDMYWAEDRIGKERMKGAYAYRQLYEQNGKFALGSDFPVESINPILGFYAAIARVDLQDFPYGGFQIQDSLTRMVALKGMTCWAAEANFEEKEKGTIEPGKMADLVVMEEDILYMDKKRIPKARVLTTIVGGEIVFSSGIR